MKYNKKRVTAIIPTKNEGQGIKKVIRSLKKYCGEIIIIDGHSADNTRKIAKEEHVKFFLDTRKGKGEAVRLGFSKAKGEIVIIFDADGSPNEKDIPRIVTPIFQRQTDIIITSRRTGGSFDFTISPTGILRTMGSDFITYLVNRRFHTNYSDVLYSFRAIRKSIIHDLDLKANEFDIEQEIIIQGLKKGYRISEIPSRENARLWGKSKLQTIMGVKLLLLLLEQLYW